MSSPIIKFYEGTGTDDQGRTLDQILGWDFNKLESIHNYIQWLFPLTDRSSANWNAPVLTQSDIEVFRSSALVRKNLVSAFHRMMSFYGFEVVNPRGTNPIFLNNGADFPERAANWLTRGNHNFLRLTRIMKSLRLAKLDPYATALFQSLDDLYKTHYSEVIGSTTYHYWKDAAE